MRKALMILFITLPLLAAAGIYYYNLDKKYFLCPIEYSVGLEIRNDNHGDGFFDAKRHGRRKHQGLDLLAPIGTPVLAARSGVVLRAKYTRGMGNFVLIKHRGGIATIYGHLADIRVSNGQRVRQGTIIGTVGKTGNANYRDILPHLHFEVRNGGVPQDPLDYLEQREIPDSNTSKSQI